VPLPLKKKNRNRSRRPFSSSRLLESNGPDIKIKGSALQIVEKYTTLSREYQTSGDPITAESYLQYAEHYQRIVDANDLKIQQNQIAEREKNQENPMSTQVSIDDTSDKVSKESDNAKPNQVIQSIKEDQIIGK
jgi:hypothetical protein